MISIFLGLAFVSASLYVAFMNRNKLINYTFLAVGIMGSLSIISFNEHQEPYMNLFGSAGYYFASFFTLPFTKPFAIAFVLYLTFLSYLRKYEEIMYILSGILLLQLPFKLNLSTLMDMLLLLSGLALISLPARRFLKVPERKSTESKQEVEPVEIKREKVSEVKVKKEEFKVEESTNTRTEEIFETPEQEIHDDEDRELMGKLIEEKFAEFGVRGKVVGYTVGPVITRYEFEPAPGIKLSKIQSLADDLALRLKSTNVRIVAPLPNKGLVGIEVPNKHRKIVWFGKLVQSDEFKKAKHPLDFILGIEPDGKLRIENIAKMPHLLIAGTTGSGKSVCINTILASLLMKNSPETLRLLLIDPKMVELSLYEGIPHLIMPIVKEAQFAVKTLKMAVSWMEYRYKLFAQVGARSLESYVSKTSRRIPYILIVIDEFADLMMTAGKDIELSITRIAQKARAVGIHLIVATQRPSVDVITGLIKANFPVRIAFKVPSKVDSRTIIDMQGAEKLLGKGDMLYIPPGSSEPIRLHGAYISEKEVTKLTRSIAGKYMKEKLLLHFPNLRDASSLVDRIFDEGYVEVFTREDTVALEEKEIYVANLINEQLEESLPVESVITHIREIRSTYYEPIEELEAMDEFDTNVSASSDRYDPLIAEAIRLIAGKKRASATFLQRKLGIGFPRASRLMDQLEELGIVGPQDGSKPREVRISPEQAEQIIRRLGS